MKKPSIKSVRARTKKFIVTLKHKFALITEEKMFRRAELKPTALATKSAAVVEVAARFRQPGKL